MRTTSVLLSLLFLIGCSENSQTTSTPGESEITNVQGADAGETPGHANADTMQLEPGERAVPGTFIDEPSGSPDLSDPNIDTSLMPGPRPEANDQ
jgi:hypothetical protein